MNRRGFMILGAAGAAAAVMGHTMIPATRGRTIIIGAGIAGLAAAAELRHKGRDVTVLEASAIAGGQARTHSTAWHALAGQSPIVYRSPVLEIDTISSSYGGNGHVRLTLPDRLLTAEHVIVAVPARVLAEGRLTLAGGWPRDKQHALEHLGSAPMPWQGQGSPVRKDLIAALARPLDDRIFFAGEATDAAAPFTLAGALRSGRREARRLG
jgi:hypothetical protein